MKRSVIILVATLIFLVIMSSCTTFPRAHKGIDIPEVIICSELRGYGDYTEKAELLPGETFYLYAPLNNVSIMTESNVIRYVYVQVELSIAGPDSRVIVPQYRVFYGRHELGETEHTDEIFFYLRLMIPQIVEYGEYTFILQVTDLITGKSSMRTGSVQVVSHTCNGGRPGGGERPIYVYLVYKFKKVDLDNGA